MKDEPIISPVDRALLKSELNQDTFVCKTNKGGNEIYVINCNTAPNVLKEVGRLRELSFRSAGGGTGKSIDLDDFDTSDRPYQQLVVYSPEEDEIVGGYRFIRCGDAIDETTGEIQLSTAHYFKFSDAFVQSYLPHTIELGRSWVQPKYQPAVNPRKGLFALANIWDGLSSIVDDNPDIKYFFGKVTMYPDYNKTARDLLLFFVDFYFPDNEKLLRPHTPLVTYPDVKNYTEIFEALDFKEGIKVLQKMIRELGESIPPLLNLYMSISPSMKNFGTAVNDDFGSVEETGILITIDEIYPETRERHSTQRNDQKSDS